MTSDHEAVEPVETHHVALETHHVALETYHVAIEHTTPRVCEIGGIAFDDDSASDENEVIAQ